MKNRIALLLLIILSISLLAGCLFSNESSFQRIKSTSKPMDPNQSTEAPLSAKEKIIPFKDPILKAYLLEQLQIEGEELTEADLQVLYILNLNQSGITDLSGLEYARNLKKLSISNARIHSLAPISELKYLTTLTLYQTQFLEVTDRIQWPRLTTFSATASVFPSYGFLTQVASLENFTCVSSNLTALTYIENNKHLKGLNVSDNAIEDITPLKDMVLLSNINLSKNPITAIGPMAQFSNLNKLDLSYTQISDISPILKLKKLVLLTAWDSEDPSQWTFDREQLKILDDKEIRVEYYGKE